MPPEDLVTDGSPEPVTEETPVEETSVEEAATESTEESVEEPATEVSEEEEKEEEVAPEEEEEGETPVDEAEETAYSEARERRKEIERKYPKLFKEFPQLRASLFRDVQFREVFPTVDDARDASQKAQFVDNLGKTLLAGDPSGLFDSVYQESPEALSKIAANFLPTLQKRSMPLYMKAVDFGLRHFVKAAHDEGVRTGNKNLELAAQHIANFGFGSPDIPEVVTPSTEESPEVKRLRDEIANRDKAVFEHFNHEITTEAKSKVMRLISETIDPNGALPKLVKEGLVRRAFDEVSEILESDQAHNARMTRLWKAAREKHFSSEAKPSIINAYLGRVRATLPDIRRRYHSEGVKAASQKTDNLPGKKLIPGSPKIGNKMPTDPKKIDWSKVSDRDILDGKIALKRA